MKIGLLFYDDDPKAAIEEKVRRAAARYREKYGEAPTACFVHPSVLAAGDLRVPGIEVFAGRSVLPNHLWLGQTDAPRAVGHDLRPERGHVPRADREDEHGRPDGESVPPENPFHPCSLLLSRSGGRLGDCR